MSSISGGSGQSESTQSGRRYGERSWELFRKTSTARTAVGLRDVTWDQTAEAILCSVQVYEDMAGFFALDYVIPAGRKNAGRPLHHRTIVKLVTRNIHRAASKFGNSQRPETARFLSCLNTMTMTKARQWLMRLKDNVRAKIFKKAANAGMSLDNSPPPLYLSHVESMVRAYTMQVCHAPVHCSMRACGHLCACPPACPAARDQLKPSGGSMPSSRRGRLLGALQSWRTCPTTGCDGTRCSSCSSLSCRR